MNDLPDRESLRRAADLADFVERIADRIAKGKMPSEGCEIR